MAAMMTLIYRGPHDSVDVPVPGTLDVIVAVRGAPVDVPEDLARRLLEAGTTTVADPDATKPVRVIPADPVVWEQAAAKPVRRPDPKDGDV